MLNKKKINKGNIRFYSKKIYKFIIKYIPKKILGYYYQIIHSLILFLGINIILFTNNINHLLIVFLLVSLDGIANFICHDCPLTLLEKKYLKTSIIDDRKKYMKKLNILFKCNHNYESQLEIIINVLSIIMTKILGIIFIKTFNYCIRSNEYN